MHPIMTYYPFFARNRTLTMFSLSNYNSKLFGKYSLCNIISNLIATSSSPSLSSSQFSIMLLTLCPHWLCCIFVKCKISKCLSISLFVCLSVRLVGVNIVIIMFFQLLFLLLVLFLLVQMDDDLWVFFYCMYNNMNGS